MRAAHSADRATAVQPNGRQRWQAPVYLSALVGGAAAGLLIGDAAARLAWLVTPALALLLLVTFLGVPLGRLLTGWRDAGFLVALLVLNFVLVPVVVWLLTRALQVSGAVLVGVLLVLLTPCIDYVVVFTGLTGGAVDRLLAATPVLLVGQLALLPLQLRVLGPPGILTAGSLGPFLEAFVLIIALPLALAAVVQRLTRRRPAAVAGAVDASMVPLMVATLALVSASQAPTVRHHWRVLGLPVLTFVCFAIVMVALGLLVGRSARLGTANRRALVLSGVTRNSLVVLPIALAVPKAFELAAAVVVTQTLVELCCLIVLVPLMRRLVPDRSGSASRGEQRGRTTAPRSAEPAAELPPPA